MDNSYATRTLPKESLRRKDTKTLYLNKLFMIYYVLRVKTNMLAMKSNRRRIQDKFIKLLLPFLCVPFMNVHTKNANDQSQRWSIRMAESIMTRRPNGYGNWDYVTGTVLKGFEELWRRTGDDRYFDYIKKTVDRVVNSDGSIDDYNLSSYNIDEINEGRMLLFLYKETGAEKYKNAAVILRSQLENHPRTSEGGFWHKQRYPHQMWLDGLYMGSPFYAEYGKLFNEPEAFDDVVKQLTLMETHARDSVSGLLYHGWDESKTQDWADPVTGCSPSFWGRAIGWYAMAIVDVLDYLPVDHSERDSVIAILQRLSDAVIKVQDNSTGVWWQVVDQGGREGNYLESSVSCMLTYAIAKGIRLGYIDKTFRSVVEKAYQGILQEFITENTDGTINLIQTCSGAGLGYGRDGSYDYYVNQAGIRDNDGKGLGPFITASLEIEIMDVPSNLRSFPTSGYQINLQWEDQSDDEDGFKIEHSSGSDFSEIAVVEANKTDFQDTGLTPLTIYIYRIRSYTGETHSLYSNTTTSSTLAENGAPAYAAHPNPSDSATSVSIAPVLSWMPGAASISHDVYFGTTDTPTFTRNQTDSTYEPGTLAENTTYFWRIDEVNNLGTTIGISWSFTTEKGLLPPGIVAHWKLDEQTGSIIYDSSGNGNNGTLVNMDNDAWDTGILGNALQFDGIDDHVQVPHDLSIDFGDQDFSISFWLKQSEADRHMRYIIKGTHDSPGTGKRYEVFHHADNELRFVVDDNVTKSRVVLPNTDFVTGEWVHVVAVRNTASDQLLLYANTDLAGSASDDTGDISQTEDLFLGVSPDEENTNFAGLLDDIRIYNYALDMAEIEEIYQNGLTDIEDFRTPVDFKLELSNYPNPFNSITNITYTVPKKAKLMLAVYNILGQEVNRIVDEVKTSGHYTINFDASHLNSGIYICRLDTGMGFMTRKMIYLQ